MNKHFSVRLSVVMALLAASVAAQAGMVQDKHGNVGYDTAEECDAAVRAGTAKFYRSFTHKPAMRRAGETSVKVTTLGAVSPNYALGACDRGVGHKAGRDGVARELIGKYVPYSPAMPVNVYYNSTGTPVRAMMKQCDNWFGDQFPRPVAAAAAAAKTAPAVVAPVVAGAAKPAVSAPAALMTSAKSAAAAATKVSPAVWGAVGAVALGTALIVAHNDDDDGATTTVTGK